MSKPIEMHYFIIFEKNIENTNVKDIISQSSNSFEFNIGVNTYVKLIDYLPQEEIPIELLNFSKEIKKYIKEVNDVNIELSREDIIRYSNIDYENFLITRRAIRAFDSKAIDRKILEKALNIARHTPSVCNRQAWRIYNVPIDMIKATLSLHNGNRGFSDQVQSLVVVCVDLAGFEGAA